MASGGYHPPANPAQVSGPGSLSQRTDSPQPKMQLSNPKYGEQQDFQAIQGGAPMQAPADPLGQGMPSPLPAPVGFDAPSTNPSEPVTAGAAAGPGPGPESLQLPSDSRDKLRATYGPILPALIAESQSKFSTQAFKDGVAALIAIIG